MKLKKAVAVVFGFALGAGMAHAGISYTCDSSVAAATCNYLNTTVAGLYNSTFTNANASIYITYGTTGLAETQSAFNVVTYNQYVTALAANTNKSGVQTSALTALGNNDVTPYGGGNVNITASLAQALGLTGLTDNGVPVGSSTPCTLGITGCYNAEITVTNDAGTPLYYDNLGGAEPSNAYDFYATVEHETDEVLGTSSCIDTGNSALSDGCNSFGPGTPSAADLFRYSAPGSLILDSSLSTTPGAYFSYDGGTTNGDSGPAGPKFYNTLANGDDYADFVSSSPSCGTNQVVQDAEGCPGVDKGLNILNDGKGEITILNAVGFDLRTNTPEPGFYGVLGAGLALLGWKYKRRNRA
jgi:hypothetical protein